MNDITEKIFDIVRNDDPIYVGDYGLCVFEMSRGRTLDVAIYFPTIFAVGVTLPYDYIDLTPEFNLFNRMKLYFLCRRKYKQELKRIKMNNKMMNTRKALEAFE